MLKVKCETFALARAEVLPEFPRIEQAGKDSAATGIANANANVERFILVP